MLATAALPGFLAVSGEPPDGTRLPSAQISMRCGPAALLCWDRPAIGEEAADRVVISLSRVNRRTTGQVSEDEIVHAMLAQPGSLVDLLPPFGAVAGDGTGIRMVADSMGFQHLFHTEPHADRAAASSSALVVGLATGAGLDEAAVGVQSLLGWQLGQRTVFQGIRKLAPGAVASIADDGLRVVQPTVVDRDPIERRAAVVRAAEMLRTSLEALLDDHPDAVLQLTGGMDSRLLLSAIPATRRRGLHAMTLDVPGKGDVAIARQLSDQFGIAHDVRGLTDVADVSPSEAWTLCRTEATRLDAMSDPVALAAQRVAERAFEQGVRISGLGGEIARGFYYVGRVVDRSYSRNDAARLASWRMFVNEAVEPGVLVDEFAAWAKETAIDEVYGALVAGGAEWFRATDELYLRHRMQRWAGATDTAVSAQRVVINPMLDSTFLDLAARLTPQDKVNSRFLAELQMELDPELGRIPLDGRPAPAAFADPSRWRPVMDAVGTGRRIVRKAAQRVQRGNRPPAGGAVLAASVVRHWRDHPDLVTGLVGVRGLDQRWVSRMLDGEVEARPSTVAFLTNLVVATGLDEGSQAVSGASSS